MMTKRENYIFWLTTLKGKRVLFEAQKLFNQILGFADRQAWLPLINAFMNREIEFGFTFQNIQTVFESFKAQPVFA